MSLFVAQATLLTSGSFSSGHSSSTTIVVLSAALFISWLVAFFLRPKTAPRTLPDVFVAGLDGGKRTIEQARKYFVTNCADMMLEGYQKVCYGCSYTCEHF